MRERENIWIDDLMPLRKVELKRYVMFHSLTDEWGIEIEMTPDVMHDANAEVAGTGWQWIEIKES